MDGVTIRLSGLTKFDMRDLGVDPGIAYEQSAIEPDTHGELALFTAVMAMSLVSMLSAYLLRRHNHQSFSEEIEIQHADGRTEKRTIRWDATSSEAPDAAIIKQIRGDVF